MTARNVWNVLYSANVFFAFGAWAKYGAAPHTPLWLWYPVCGAVAVGVMVRQWKVA